MFSHFFVGKNRILNIKSNCMETRFFIIQRFHIMGMWKILYSWLQKKWIRDQNCIIQAWRKRLNFWISGIEHLYREIANCHSLTRWRDGGIQNIPNEAEDRMVRDQKNCYLSSESDMMTSALVPKSLVNLLIKLANGLFKSPINLGPMSGKPSSTCHKPRLIWVECLENQALPVISQDNRWVIWRVTPLKRPLLLQGQLEASCEGSLLHLRDMINDFEDKRGPFSKTDNVEQLYSLSDICASEKHLYSKEVVFIHSWVV